MKYVFITLCFSVLLLLILMTQQKNHFSAKSNQEEPSDWFIAQRSYPYGKVDYTAYKIALQKKSELTAVVTERDNLIWQAEGPYNIGGRIQDVEMDPTNMQIIYAGAATGGIFKSTDQGATWTPIFDLQPSLSIGDIAIAPLDPETIYAGTGEPNCGGGSITYDGAGIFKSLDGGESWNYTGLDSSRNTGRIVVDPKNTNRVFAATMGDLFADSPHRGVYRTEDGGASWQQVLFLNDSTGAIDLAINRLHPDTIFACTWERVRRPTYEHYGGASSGIYRSYDGGNTWTELTSGLPSGNTVGRIGIDISQSNPAVLYAIYADDVGYFNGIYKTSDNGDNWTHTNDAALSGMFASYGWWFGRIKVDPISPNIAYAIGFDEYKTENGGTTWNSSGGSMHVDHHTMYIHPLDHNLILDGNDGGVYKSTNGSSSWTHYDNIANSQFYTCELDNSNTQRLYGGLQDNNVVRTLTGGLNDWQSIIGGDGFYVLVDPVNANYVYAESQYGALNKSTNGGTFFSSATNGIGFNDRHNWNTPVAFNPKNPKSLYYGSNKLYKSINRASNWNVISPDLTNGSGAGNITFGTITTISVSPVDTNTIYAGTDDGNVWMTSNNGVNWTNVSSTLPDRWVTRVTCDPKDELKAYVTFSGYRFNDNMVHVYMTEDGGQSWESISGNLPDIPTNDILVDTSLNNTLYIATDVGVFYSSNMGNSWNVLGTGLPTVPVTDLTFHEPTKTLLAATYGRSMYSLDLNNLPTGNPNPVTAVFSLTIFPNPVQDMLNVDFISDQSQKGMVKVMDVNGRVVWETQKSFSKGKNNFHWNREGENGSKVSPGIYFLCIEMEEKKVVKKFQVL